jgi:DNA repair exonuclease SbcCD ATPase subunit
MRHIHKMPVIGYLKTGKPVYAIAGGADDEQPTGGLKVDLSTPDEVPPPTSQQVREQNKQHRQGEEYFTADDIEKVRKQEKDKLYNRLQDMEGELETLRKEREAALREQEEAEARSAAERTAQEREELDAKELVAKVEQTWQERFDALQSEREQERALLEKERQFSQLNEYRMQRLSDPEVEGSIMPELRDLIVGDSPEEIESAIANMQQRTARILEQARTFAQTQRQQMPGVRATDPSIGPVEENDSAHQTVTAEQIKSMSMTDYVKYRGKLLTAAREKVQQTGLYGN